MPRWAVPHIALWPCIAIWALATPCGHAQTAAPGSQGQQSDQGQPNDQPGLSPPSDSKSPDSAPDDPLGDRLAKKKGVVHPPDVDPGMVKPAPDQTGDKSVVPPPGTPQNRPDIQPK